MSPTEEQDYIDRVKNGDSASYAFIVDSNKHMAYMIALKIVRNPEEAEDIAQESFIKAFQQLHQFQGKAKFSTWLYTIVYRTAVSRLKENRIETLSISATITENYHEDDRSPQEDQMRMKDEQRYVKQAIEKLPRTEALLVTLYYLNENSVKEIQQITGLSLPNIKINLFRARKRLEKELQFLLNNES